MTQHANLSAERWARFSLDQQVLMIANEMHRASSLFAPDRHAFLRLSYERVLRLVDLRVAVQPTRTLRRDLLCCLLRLRPEASRQIPLLLG